MFACLYVMFVWECVFFTDFEVLFVKVVGTLGGKGLGDNAGPHWVERLLDKVAFVLLDLPKVDLKVRVRRGLVLCWEVEPLDVVHLEQKFCVRAACHVLFFKSRLVSCLCVCFIICFVLLFYFYYYFAIFLIFSYWKIMFFFHLSPSSDLIFVLQSSVSIVR